MRVRFVVATLCVLAFGIAVCGSASAGLVDQRGAPFALPRRSPVVVTFIATRCTDACPIANAVFSAAIAKAAKERVAATFVTVTLDPDYDTPIVMSEFAGRLGADPRRWRFVSGTRSDVRALMRRFGVEVQPGTGGVPEAHSSFIYVSTKQPGRDRAMRTLFLSSDAPERIVNLLKKA